MDSLKETAIRILHITGEAMPVKKITEYAIDCKLIEDKQPDFQKWTEKIANTIIVDIKRHGTASVFKKDGKGIYSINTSYKGDLTAMINKNAGGQTRTNRKRRLHSQDDWFFTFV